MDLVIYFFMLHFVLILYKFCRTESHEYLAVTYCFQKTFADGLNRKTNLYRLVTWVVWWEKR